MRVDAVNGLGSFLLIYDLDGGKRYRLDEKKKQVFVMDLKEESERMKGTLMFQNLRKVIKPTGRQLQIAGVPCEEYTYDLQAPTGLWHGVSMILHEKGTVCATQTLAAGRDAMTFIHDALKRDYIAGAYACGSFSSPVGPSFYGEQTNLLLLSSTSESGFEGGVALDVGGMGSSQYSMTVAAINMDQIPEEVFWIPPGWKMKKESTPH